MLFLIELLWSICLITLGIFLAIKYPSLTKTYTTKVKSLLGSAISYFKSLIK